MWTSSSNLADATTVSIRKLLSFLYKLPLATPFFSMFPLGLSRASPPLGPPLTRASLPTAPPYPLPLSLSSRLTHHGCPARVRAAGTGKSDSGTKRQRYPDVTVLVLVRRLESPPCWWLHDALRRPAVPFPPQAWPLIAPPQTCSRLQMSQISYPAGSSWWQMVGAVRAESLQQNSRQTSAEFTP